MELVPEECLPCGEKSFSRIFGRAEPCGKNCCSLCGVCKKLVLTVPSLVDCV